MQDNLKVLKEALQDQDDEEVDLDLSAMSDTVRYSVVFDMSENPEEYMGKTVNMTGSFASMYGEKQGEIKEA